MITRKRRVFTEGRREGTGRGAYAQGAARGLREISRTSSIPLPMAEAMLRE